MVNRDGALVLGAWKEELPLNDSRRDFLLNGVRDGFHIVNSVPETGLRPVFTKNYKSATCHENRSKVEEQIKEELVNGRYEITETPPTIVSALGAIPKKNSSKVRLIHDCSRPEGRALNDLAEQNHFKYHSIQEATKMLHQGSYMAKIDLLNAYRSVKIHPSNYTFTGLQWKFQGDETPSFIVDKRLPFGARLSPEIFTELGNAIIRIMASKGHPSVVVYLDDFLVTGKTKEECQQTFDVLFQLLRKLGFAINFQKLVSPTQRLTFLGVILDTNSMTLELPKDRVTELKELLKTALQKPKLSKHQLQSIAGKLNWATNCIYGGRFFLRRIFDKIATLKRPFHRTGVTKDIKDDIQWWIQFIDIFNGCTPMIDNRPTAPLWIDACNVAAGGVHGEEFVYTPWEWWPGTLQRHINYKETLALEPAVTFWAPKWQNKLIRIYSDNQAAVGIFNKGSCRDPFVMASLRRIFWLSAVYNFRLKAFYLPGSQNKLADAVSRLHENK